MTSLYLILAMLFALFFQVRFGTYQGRLEARHKHLEAALRARHKQLIASEPEPEPESYDDMLTRQIYEAAERKGIDVSEFAS